MHNKQIGSHMCIEVFLHGENNAAFRFYDNFKNISKSVDYAHCEESRTTYFMAGEGKGRELIEKVDDPDVTGKEVLDFLLDGNYVLQSATNDFGDSFDSLVFVSKKSGEETNSLSCFLVDNGRGENRVDYAPNDCVFSLRNFTNALPPYGEISLADYDVFGIKKHDDNNPAFYLCWLQLAEKGKPEEEAKWVPVNSDLRPFALKGVESLNIIPDGQVIRPPEK